MEVCEVRVGAAGPVTPPTNTDKAQRVAAEGELVLGWRPAIGQEVPNTKWVLEEKLGEGGFGEVWKARHEKLDEQRVFKFCFRADRVRSLKREVTLFRLLKERIGENPNIVRLHDIYFDQPPFYLEEEYVSGKDLKSWCEAQGGVGKVPLEVRLEIVAQAADGLQAAHDAGVIHRDVKPGNILIENPKSEIRNPKLIQAKLTDFGIGQVLSEEYLSGITRAGFTQTMLSTSSSQTGTQLYMAPELLAGKPASTRSDIYSLGVVLYQLLVGDFTRPVTTDWAGEIADPLLREDLGHCFAGSPQGRFGGAGDLGKSLRRRPKRQLELAERQAALAVAERAAYRRGVVRTAIVATMLVTVFAWLAVNAFRSARSAAIFGEQANRQWQRAQAGELAARQNLYAADMNLAQQALQANSLGRALELLERNRPQLGQPDLRDWEWRYLWRLCRSDALFTLYGHSNTVAAVAFSPDGRILATGSGDKTVKLWDISTRKEIATLPHNDRVPSVTFSPDGRFLTTACDDRTIRIWDATTRSNLAKIVTDSPFEKLALSANGKILATSGSSQVTLWEISSRSRIMALPSRPSSGLSAGLAFSPDSRTLA